MRKTTANHYIGAVLASMLLATYPVSLVEAYAEKLTDQGMNMEQIQSQVQSMVNMIIADLQKREQSSLSLRDFSENNLFSCRGLA